MEGKCQGCGFYCEVDDQQLCDDCDADLQEIDAPDEDEEEE